MISDLELSVEENLIIRKAHGVPRAKRERLVKELLEAVELTHGGGTGEEPVGRDAAARRDRGLVHEPFFSSTSDTGSTRCRASPWEMLEKIGAERNLTILITTHYMDDADKLCDRIAIVDHGELKAPTRRSLKASIPGKNSLEASFSSTPPGWQERVEKLPGVESVTAHENIFRIATGRPGDDARPEEPPRRKVTVARCPFRARRR